MIASSDNDYFVISDSDILVGPDFLRNVIPPLLDPKVGLVTCLYQGIPAPDFWSQMEAIGMSVEMPAGVMVADMVEGMKFALGAAMTVRRDAIEASAAFARRQISTPTISCWAIWSPRRDTRSCCRTTKLDTCSRHARCGGPSAINCAG